MIGRTNAGGGGGGLNFSIVGGTVQPENQKENTIWVNTSVAITGWAFSATEPESPEEGMVWIATGLSSTVDFNALKKNCVQVYPIYAKQYISAAWSDVTAQTYQDGAWSEWWNGHLFDHGNVFEYVTGGYVAIAKPLVSGADASVPNISDTSDGGRKIYPRNSNGGMYHTVNKIDLSSYTTLKFLGRVVDPSGYNRSGIGVWNGIGNSADINRVAYSTGNDGSNATRSIDVSKLTGEYYIGFYVYGDSYVTLAQLWLE